MAFFSARPPLFGTAISRWGYVVLALLFVSSGVTPEETGPSVGIVLPDKRAPAERVTDLLEVQVRLRLPLTPPPGVQQPAALKGWRVILARRDILTPRGERTAARYALPVMRLRPMGSGDL